MCLLLVAHDSAPEYRLIVAANRDEFHDRPAQAAAFWADAPHIFGGRDLEAGGTWLACDQRGRFATITNVRSGLPIEPAARSRGLIVRDFLDGQRDAAQFNNALAVQGQAYSGFNVLTYDGGALNWYSNLFDAPRSLAPGEIYTLSNAALDTVWPKTERLREGFAAANPADPNADELAGRLMAVLTDAQLADVASLPDSGIDPALEHRLSSIFIRGDAYGTRCSTVLLIDRNNRLHFYEQRYDADADVTGSTVERFELARRAL